MFKRRILIVVVRLLILFVEQTKMEDCSPLDDYALISVIGKGSYAKVILVRKKTNSQLYAIKSMKKKYIEKKGQAKRIMMERDILTSISHPFLIKIHASFQDDKKLFLVLEYCPGGELFGLLSKRKRLLQSEARFFAAQVLLALEYLHSKNIIYRDLKPENILIGADGYIKLTDFGLSKNNILTDYDTFSVCGTPQYLAPQVIKKEGHGKAVDWWCLGSLIYELIHGLPPFYSKNRSELFDKIKHNEPYLNKNWSNDLKDLFGKLFEKKAEQRLINIANIKHHPWFATINWEYLIDKKIKPTYVPTVGEDNGLPNFDKQFTTCSLESNASSFSECKKFEGFSFENSKSPNSPQLCKMEAEPFDSDEQIVFVEEKP